MADRRHAGSPAWAPLPPQQTQRPLEVLPEAALSDADCGFRVRRGAGGGGGRENLRPRVLRPQTEDKGPGRFLFSFNLGIHTRPPSPVLLELWDLLLPL